MSGDIKRVLEVNQIDNLQGSTQRVKQETTLNNLRGITQRVYVVGGGGAPVIDELNVTPSTSAQTITAPEGTDGYSPVNVSAVTSAIDANITAENIKKDVEILGVTGSYEGQTPTGTMYIISNGTYNVADKAIADVQVPTTAPDYYAEKTKDANNVLQQGSGMNSFAGIANIGAYVCANMYRINGNGAQNKVLTVDMSDILNLSNDASCENMFMGQGSSSGYYTELNIDLSNLVSITGQNACYQMFNINSSYAKLNINLASLQTINGTNACNGMFRSFSAISGYLIDFTFPSLKTIDGSRSCVSMFDSNRIIKKLLFPELKSISGSTSMNSLAKDATFLTESSFDKLDTISIQMGSSSQPMFGGCVALESVSFGGVKASTFSGTQNQLQYLFNTTTGSQATGGCTVHFPSNFDPSDPNHTFDASTLTGYPTFGGSASYIHLAYDLPATES